MFQDQKHPVYPGYNTDDECKYVLQKLYVRISSVQTSGPGVGKSDSDENQTTGVSFDDSHIKINSTSLML